MHTPGIRYYAVLCSVKYRLYGNQVRELYPLLDLVYPITSWDWFLWYDFNMFMWPYSLHSPQSMYRCCPILFPRINPFQSVLRMWCQANVIVCGFTPEAPSSFTLKTESKAACNMESWGKAQPGKPLFYTIWSHLQQAIV